MATRRDDGVTYVVTTADGREHHFRSYLETQRFARSHPLQNPPEPDSWPIPHPDAPGSPTPVGAAPRRDSAPEDRGGGAAPKTSPGA